MRAFRAKTVFAVFSAVAVLVGIVPPVSAEPSPSGFDIMLGEDANRSNPVPLDGLTVSGDIFVFLLPENGPNRVRFYLNDPELSSRHFSQVNKPPWDLVGSDEDGNALPFDTTELADGLNTLTAVIFFRGGVSERVDIEFEVDNDVTVPSLELSPDSVSLDVDFGGSSIFHLDLTSTGGEPAEFTVETDEVWLSVSPTSGTSPSSLEVTVDASDLAAGTHASNVTATATGYEPAVAEVTVNVDAPPDPDPGCFLVPEEFGVVSLPFELVFGGDEEGLCDVNDVGTGFPRVDPPSNGEGYIQENLEIASGLLNVTTTAGLNHRAVNNLDNALSVGVPPFEGTLTVETSIVDPPAGTGNFEQAGIWFGNGEDDFVKLVVQSRSSPALEMLVEVGGSITASQTVAPSGLGSAGTVDLRLRMDPVALTAHGEYRLDGGAWQDVATFGVPADFFPDGEPEPDETNSFAGIMASHRNGPSPLVYAFDSFSLEQSETEAGLVFSPGAMTVDVDAGDSTSIEVGLSASDGAPVSFEVASDSSWVTVDPAVGVTPADLEVTVDASDLAEGTHTANVTATASGYESATVVVTANVSEPATESLLVVPDSVEVSLDAGGSEVVEFEVVASDGEVVSFGVVSDVGWLVPEGGVTPGAVEVLVDSDGLDPGSHVGVLTFSASGYEAAEVVVSLVVTDPDATCFMVPEEFGIVGLPFQLGFDGDAGGLCDVGFVGTGFLRVDPPSEGVGYVQENLLVASGDGELVVTTTAGLALANTQDNALSVGLSPPGNVLLVETTVLDPPLEGVEGSFAQAGVWFGNGEDDYVKLVVVARGNNLNIEMREDRNGVGNQQQFRGAAALNTAGRVGLRLTADPVNLTVTGHFRIDDGEWRLADSFVVPGELFTADHATLPPGETRTFTGILASHRNADVDSLDYRFDGFSVVESPVPPPSSADGFVFNRVEVTDQVPSPTAMVLGPDNRLYVTTVFGALYRITLNPVTHEADLVESFDTLTGFYGEDCRLALGITVDPDSTSEDVVLWVASAADNCSTINFGGFDAGSIVRISGEGLDEIEEFVSGLPRARENHSLNAVRFGPDGRLYLAAGGLTGAGQPPDGDPGIFGFRREQPLSAALLVMDVKDPSWDPETDGQCATGVRSEGGTSNFPNRIDELGDAWTCGVEVFATGFRNMYDFVFHSNGGIYGADNGLGLNGTPPLETTPDCRYEADGETAAFGTIHLEPQPDLLHRIVEDRYYGHPNPSRDECVFMDGSAQSAPPLPNFTEPIYDLGEGRSANGIIEYTSNAYCGALQGDLLITNFSSGWDLTRVQLSADGTEVEEVTETPGPFTGFTNPLPLVEGPDGTIYVGEFIQADFQNGGKITAIVPIEGGCFEDLAPMPEAVLDAGAAEVDGRMYVVGGKIASESGPVHVNSLYVYDPDTDQWFTGPDKPGFAVENPAVVGYNGKIYVFGGSTDPFTGFRDQVWIYTPGGPNGNQGFWTQGESDGFTNRGGAAAEVLNDKIYVIGGLGCPDGGTFCAGNQTSLTSVQIYDPNTDSWTDGPSLTTPRDNPGSAVLNGNIYVFGGRTWDENPTLNSVEYLTGSGWQSRAPMPTGRRAMIVGTIGGKAQVMGGESPLFTQNEQYDPTTNTWTTLTPMNPGRHGAAHTTINNTLYITGGGPTAGTSFTNSTIKYHFP